MTSKSRNTLLNCLKSSSILVLITFASLASGEVVPKGALISDVIHFEFAVYYLPTSSSNPLDALNKAITADKQVGFKKVSKLPKTLKGRVLMAHLENDVGTKYAPPDIDFLKYFGRGIDLAQARALQTSKQALILDFAYPKTEVWTGLKAAYQIAESVARDTNGLLWDEQTREVFSPEEWHAIRLAQWSEKIPNTPKHIVIHAYNTDNYVRAITLGMSKFGLPDVVIEKTSWSANRQIGNLINGFCQSIAEGASVEKNGKFKLDLRAIQNKEVHTSQTNFLKANATAVAKLHLTQGTREEGDPSNRLIEISFQETAEKDIHAERERVLAELYGWEDDIARIKHTKELLAASKRAKSKLPLLKKAFLDGLAPGEYIEVKAPFATANGGQEWMWVEITTWHGANIKGLLKNEPFDIPTLHGGQMVNVMQDKIFDYIRRYPDGRQEGNETGEIIERMQKANGR
jgi:uncharacterized protein YegJ (DUF2314 family)